MSVYGNYARNITRTSPFVWAHRLEIPLVPGTAAIILSLIAAAVSGVEKPLQWTTGFFTLTFFCALVTLFWLVLLSRTLDLRYSLNASRYPLYTVVIIGAAIINASPFVFSNMAEYYHWRDPHLFKPSAGNDEPWGTFGLAVYLAFISIGVLFALLIRRVSFQGLFLSFFICVSTLLSYILYFALFAKNAREGALAFGILYTIASAAGVSCWIATYLGHLKKYQDMIFGTILFLFSPAYLYLLYFVLAENHLIPILGATGQFAEAARDTSFWAIILLFCVGLGLNELTFSVMRKARRYAS